MYEGKVKRSEILVPDGQSPRLRLCLEKWDDCRVLSVPTEIEQFGSPEDVLALDVMKAYCDLLDGKGTPYEKMYGRRLNGGKRSHVIDRIRLDTVRLPPGLQRSEE